MSKLSTNETKKKVTEAIIYTPLLQMYKWIDEQTGRQMDEQTNRP